jgi:hypothetical protein
MPERDPLVVVQGASVASLKLSENRISPGAAVAAAGSKRSAASNAGSFRIGRLSLSVIMTEVIPRRSLSDLT